MGDVWRSDVCAADCALSERQEGSRHNRGADQSKRGTQTRSACPQTVGPETGDGALGELRQPVEDFVVRAGEGQGPGIAAAEADWRAGKRDAGKGIVVGIAAD